MMDLDGAVKTSGDAEHRNWHTGPRKRRYDPYYFRALSYQAETLDAMVVRIQALTDHEARMAEGY